MDGAAGQYLGDVEKPAMLVTGCDDAPVVSVARMEKPRFVHVILPYYENPETLAARMVRFGMWSEEFLNWIEVFIVDDGSPQFPAEKVLRQLRRRFPVTLARIHDDVPWNWIAARNVGFHLVKHLSWGPSWCVVTDMDHAIPLETMEALVYGEFDPGVIYRFSRKEHTGEDIHPHPNSWFLTREMFWKIGGYDEALSGHYGTDKDFRARAAATAPVQILTDVLIRGEHIGDSSTRRYQRKLPEDAEAVARIIAARGEGWSPKVLSFPWREVKL
jgi:hypothetical protein